LGSTKEQRGNRRHLWSGAPDCPVHHRTVSGAPEDYKSNSSPSGKSRGDSAIIHRTIRCTPDSVRCSKRTRLWNLAASGIRNGCSAIIHRTCPVYTGLSGVTTGQWLLRRQRLPADALNARQRAQKSGTPMLAHRTLYSACPVRHRTSRRAQRQSPNGWNPNGRVMWLAHRTCPVCTGLSCAPCDRQPPPKRLVWWLGL
jgi:hypothetical protein